MPSPRPENLGRLTGALQQERQGDAALDSDFADEQADLEAASDGRQPAGWIGAELARALEKPQR